MPTSQKYFENVFPSQSFTLKDVHIFPRILAINIRLRVCQYKVVNNALYLYKHLYIFKLSDTQLCSFSIQEDETIIHLFLTALKVEHGIP